MNVTRMFVLRYVQKRDGRDVLTRECPNTKNLNDRCQVGFDLGFVFSIIAAGKNWHECLHEYKRREKERNSRLKGGSK